MGIETTAEQDDYIHEASQQFDHQKKPLAQTSSWIGWC